MREIAFILAAAVTGAASAQVSFVEVARISTAGTGIGNNVSAVAWNGSSLFAAGFNNTGATADAGIVGFDDVLGTISAPNLFGVLSTPALRGFSGLDISGDTLAAAYDDGADDPNGIQAFDLDGTHRWSKLGRGGSGVGIDPGFAGAGAGVGWTNFSSGRRILQDTSTGADVFTAADGMIVNGAGTGTFWRDMDFASDGDIWLREGNNVISANRTGGNSVNTAVLVVDEPEADFVNQQNLAVLETGFGSWVIYNDRDNNGSAQDLSTVIKLIDLAGGAATASFTFSVAPELGNGAYDFSYDAASGTIAISDSINELVYIMRVVPAPAPAGLLAAAGLVAARRRR